MPLVSIQVPNVDRADPGAAPIDLGVARMLTVERADLHTVVPEWELMQRHGGIVLKREALLIVKSSAAS